MENKNKVNSVILVAGRPQHGKTFYTEKLAEKITENGGFVFVYNPGRPTDWADAVEATPIHPKVIARKKGLSKPSDINRFIEECDTIDVWEVGGKYYKAEQIPFAFKGKTLKCYRDTELEQRFYATVFRYFHSGLLVLDDNRSAGRRTSNLLQLYSRSNHTGKKYTERCGINIAVVYHNLDTPPKELYDYLTHIVLFQVNRAPDNLKMPELESEIASAVDWLATAPKYSRCEMHLLGAEVLTKKIKKHT
jgi:hypothetical protein